MAIAAGGPPDRLDRVVSSLDYLNRDMPSADEFQDSVTRLGQAGLIQVGREGFGGTPAGLKIVDRFSRKGKVGVIQMMMRINEEWKDRDFDPVIPTFQFRLQPDDWDRAQQAYLDWYEDWKKTHK
jgi:hypothetical protein